MPNPETGKEIDGEGSYVFEGTKALRFEDGSPHVKTEGERLWPIM